MQSVMLANAGSMVCVEQVKKLFFFPFEYSDLFTGSFKSVWYPEKDTI